MKRFALLILLVSAVTASVFLALNRPGAEASPDVTITVSHPLDILALHDGLLTLREAMMLATGDLPLSVLGPVECAYVSGAVYLPHPSNYCTGSDLPGDESADTIVFHAGFFPPGDPTTITLLMGTLPELHTGDDTVDGSSAGVIVDGVSQAFDCFEITSDNNTIKGLEIRNCHVGLGISFGAQDNTVGGNTEADRNVISGNEWGVTIVGDNNTVKGNFIGANSAGTAPLPNGAGVAISDGAQNNTIGGSSQTERNLISGNSFTGVMIVSSGTNDNVVKGNYIGTNVSGTAALPNGECGVVIYGDAQNNTVGGTASDEGNVIAFNDGVGVRVEEANTTGNTIRGNSIHSNGGKGIDLVDGGNEELPPPTITGFGSVMGTACADCEVDIHSDDDDEGRVYEGSTTADDDGNWTFSGTPEGPNVTATATDSEGNTSEFSDPQPVSEATPTPTTPPVPSNGDTRTLVWSPGWHNDTWSGASTPEQAFACATGNFAAAYRLVGGRWEIHFPDRPDISTMGPLQQYSAFLILITEEVTCEMPVADAPGAERTLEWGVGWHNDGWTGPDGSAPEDAFSCAEGSYAAAYRLVGGGWESHFPDRPDISDMGPLNKHDAFLILVTAPVSCSMPIAP